MIGKNLLTLTKRAQMLALILLVIVSASGVSAQGLLPGFAEMRTLGGLTSDTVALASGDVNGDGAPDIVSGSSDGSLWLSLNDGAGNFPTASQIGSESLPAHGLRLVDLNGDLDLDLVGSTAGKVFVYQYQDGAFGSYETVGPTGVTIAEIQVALINNDTRPDIVVAVNSGQSAVLLNDGSGGFYFGPFTCDSPSEYRCYGTLTQTIGGLAAGDVDNDGDTDLVVGRALYTQSSYIFLNDGYGNLSVGGTLPTPAFYSLRGIALGDLNGDARLDILTNETNATNPTQSALMVYLSGGGTYAAPVQVGGNFASTLESHPFVLDIDLDSDLDILFSMPDQHVFFLNNGSGAFYSGALDCDAPPENAYCFARGADFIRDLAVVDMDNDGDLDLAAIFSNATHMLYFNDGTASLPRSSGLEISPVAGAPQALALGDLNGDGRLDAVAGSLSTGVVLFGQGDNSFAIAQGLVSGLNYQDVKIADLDGDNHLDILAATNPGYVVAFFNNGSGAFYSGAALDCGNENVACLGGASDANINIALGDVDGDSDVDVLANRALGQRNLYLNDGLGGFGTVRNFGYAAASAGDVAFADVDIDGDLDAILVQALAIPGHVYLNDGQGNYHAGAFLCSAPPANVRCFDNGKGTSLATADLNADGLLDIIVGKDTGQSRLYLNDGLGNFNGSSAARSFGGMQTAQDVAALDADGDGDLDIAAANGASQADLIYLNDGLGTFGSLAATRSFGESSDDLQALAAGDLNGDGPYEVVVLEASGGLARLSVAANYTRNARGTGLLPDNLPYIQLGHPAGSTPPAEGYASSKILSSNEISFTYKLFDPQGNKVSRIAVFFSPDGGGKWYPALPKSGVQTTNLTASPTGTQYTYTWDTAASSFFGKSDRVVLRLLAYSDTFPAPFSYASASTYPFRMRGMQVRVLNQSSQPVQGARVLRSTGGDFETILDGAGNPRLTNANGYLEGRGALQSGDGLVALYPVETQEHYTLYHTNAVPTTQGATGHTISAFGVQTLTVSSSHPLILFNFTISLQWDARNDPAYIDRLQYDLQTASQRLYDWSNGQIALGELTVYQSRGLWNDALIRIYANNRFRPTAMKGGIVSAVTYDPEVPTISYAPGQIHIGAVWNRYGTPGSNLEQDWPRALAHEMNHYALFLDDNYLGLDDDGNVIPVDSCPSVMSDPYRKDYPYDEYHPADAWDAECADTLSNRLTGRSDWETVSLFYSAVGFTTVNTGPNGMPLAVTQVDFVDLEAASTALADPTFYLTQDGGRVEPGRQARAFLFQNNWAVDLGKPTIDHILARGAKPGDRVCLYEPEANRLGCETVTLGDEQIALTTFSDWQPQIVVSPLSSTTIEVHVSGLPSGMNLSARLYPVMNPAGSARALTYAGGQYSTTFTLAEPAMEGYVLVYANQAEPRREAIVDYAIGGSPANIRGSNANIRGSNAPASSTDGQVILFTPDTEMEEDEFYTLQALTQAPDLPVWAGVASRPYRIAASAGAPALAGSSITFSYMGDEVVSGEEDWLKVYYWDGANWQPLPTRLDTYFNTASAPADQPGIYILLSSIEIQLYQGWNLVAYPLQIDLSVGTGFASLGEVPTLTVYGYDPLSPTPWQIYHPGAPAWVNGLEVLGQGEGYWIYTSQDATWRLSGGMAEEADASSELNAGAPLPPTFFYGWATPGLSFAPQVGTPVQAYVNGALCGQTTVFEADGELVYVLEVPESDTCGALGRTVTFYSSGSSLIQTAEWNSQTPVRADLLGYNPAFIRQFLPSITR